MLARAGHEVEAVPDGQAAWEAYLERPAPVVVTDWLMPRLSGVELCRRIRKAKDAPHAHVLIVTSLSVSEHTIEAFESGVDDIFAKPFDGATVLGRIGAFERSRLAVAEQEVRKSVERFQDAVAPGDGSVFEALADLVELTRRQRAYVRCRAFLRRQIELARDCFGVDDARTRRLEGELAELAKVEGASDMTGAPDQGAAPEVGRVRDLEEHGEDLPLVRCAEASP